MISPFPAKGTRQLEWSGLDRSHDGYHPARFDKIPCRHGVARWTDPHGPRAGGDVGLCFKSPVEVATGQQLTPKGRAASGTCRTCHGKQIKEGLNYDRSQSTFRGRAMTEPTLNEVGQRVSQLEREIRLWKAVSVVVLSVLGIVSVIAATGGGVADEVRAKRFVLVGFDGKERVTLGSEKTRNSEKHNSIALKLLDKDGVALASLGVWGGASPETAGLLLSSGRGPHSVIDSQGVRFLGEDGSAFLMAGSLMVRAKGGSASLIGDSLMLTEAGSSGEGMYQSSRIILTGPGARIRWSAP